MKKLVAAVLCLVLVFARFPMSAFAVEAYSKTSTTGAKLMYPYSDAYFETPLKATVKACYPQGSIYFMPMPEEGNGNLGLVAHGTPVTILADMGGFWFFQTEDGRCGWNGAKFFELDEEQYNNEHEAVVVVSFD